MSHPDPYPTIPPALLNSGDIRAYAEHPSVRFMQPFVVDNLKSASYHIPCEGTIFAWKTVEGAIPSIEKEEVELKAGKEFTIRPNSIVYLFPMVVFKLPEYLAIRFNLTIRKVHQGLLLGTGPLVDPGFEGRLLIPLHNLTTQEIVVDARDMLMWVEVTKLSPDQTKLCTPAHSFPLKPFPENKKNLTALDYFRQANHGLPILSSVQNTLDDMRIFNKSLKGSLEKQREEAELERKKRDRLAMFTAVFSVIGLFVALFAIYHAVIQVVQTAHGKFDSISTSYSQQKVESDRRRDEMTNILKEVRELKASLAEIQENSKLHPPAK
jgi:deoxycytidine triphosphate deaminase